MLLAAKHEKMFNCTVVKITVSFENQLKNLTNDIS